MKVLKGLKNGKKKTWKCEYGCRVTKTPCRHLESLLLRTDGKGRKDPSFESVYKYSGNKVDSRYMPTQAAREDRLKERLQGIIDPIAVRILVLKYEFDETFEDISKELGINNTETVVRLHEESLKKLRSIW